MKTGALVTLFGLGGAGGAFLAIQRLDPIMGIFAMAILVPIGAGLGIGLGFLVARKLWG